ncbi:pallilysin-related adhesin [Treponema phagedenis]|uniref:pallilysin-related adhesin n=1 Tax=Treponema phagedenis TaxID=162 RepID=UPI0001F641E9|nr:pallilysin-related adhesin [Treponema phagedenis]EFW39331.1 hypothetical protein HMPREF9554_00138 [Treponema phagedenis F0421]TYT77853.1 pallilysin-related adhesin [Treponema phagedenis]
MKKVFYLLLAIFVVGIGVLLFLNRIKIESTTIEKQNAQTIIPVAAESSGKETAEIEDSTNQGKDSLITLRNNESFVQSLLIDMNGDGIEDQIIAVKKLADPFIYLIISLQDPMTQKFERTDEIRTGVIQSKTFSLYASKIKDSNLPALIYMGMTSNNQQLLTIYLTELDKKNKISFHLAADLRCDGEISIKDSARNEEDVISNYTIYSYNSDPDKPNTLDQIEQIYRWDQKTKVFAQISETKIPGKKIEAQLLQKLSTGNVNLFEDFLSGLWYQPSSGKNGRTLFFSTEENEVIFSIDNIEEIYMIDAAASRRYGIYFSTKNASISSIHRRLDVKLNGVDEIQVRVIEDVARLKIGTASTWDGVYKKKPNTSILKSTDSPLHTRFMQVLKDYTEPWTNSAGESFQTVNEKFTLKTAHCEDSGWYAVLEIKDKAILQCKHENPEKNDVFYHIDLQAKEEKKYTLSLIEVTVSANSITPTGAPPLIFEQQKLPKSKQTD